ncbi:MAG TPA: DUF6141 family protein [Ignavibacteriaceae bacterium]|jgi:hypothetical protein|nr:DUF6141 family protein [Ignavibacteriaceae bacterium]
MEGKILFSEKQRFNQWWLWAILIGINLLFLYVAIFQPNIILTLSFVFTLILILLFLIFRLETRISEEKIYVRFYPFQLKFKEYRWSEISKCSIRQYSPIGEYGGWGLRGFGKNKAINISGNQGLQLDFINNKKLLIGTNKTKELTEALEKTGKLNI